MKADQVTLTFDKDFVGEMVSPTGHVKLGSQNEGVQPYHLLFGALGACFYATFLSVSNKMRLTFSDVAISVNGNKKEDVPTTLDHVEIAMIIYNGSDEKKLYKAAELGAKYCSIHETISQVADIDLKITFEDKA